MEKLKEYNRGYCSNNKDKIKTISHNYFQNNKHKIYERLKTKNNFMYENSPGSLHYHSEEYYKGKLPQDHIVTFL